MLIGILIGFLSIISLVTLIAFFMALAIEAQVGFGYPPAFRVAVWSALTFAISFGLILLLAH